jgi:hypothetical protein
LTADDGVAEDVFGASVAISGDTVIVGSPFDIPGYDDYRGSAIVFVRRGTTWKYVEKLTASDDVDLDAEFGYSVAISGDRTVVGIPLDGSRKGSANVFTRLYNE